MTEIDDTINLGTALAMVGRKPGDPKKYAGCPRCNEPLICTMERRGAEFHCMVCGGWFGFLAPKPLDVTPEMDKRYEQLDALFSSGIRGPMKEGDDDSTTESRADTTG